MIKYQGRVQTIGPLVLEFAQAGMLVFFGQKSREELRDFSVIHDGLELLHPVDVGDVIKIGRSEYRILAVGHAVNENLASQGHFILKFNNKPYAQLPSDINVDDSMVPAIEPGIEFVIQSVTE